MMTGMRAPRGPVLKRCKRVVVFFVVALFYARNLLPVAGSESCCQKGRKFPTKSVAPVTAALAEWPSSRCLISGYSLGFNRYPLVTVHRDEAPAVVEIGTYPVRYLLGAYVSTCFVAGVSHFHVSEVSLLRSSNTSPRCP
ncbi:hypothetical protein LZ32DRAFT_159285 [Colletotrichum eremochloae]|nr:hypothetical protein LZ32DRAFT_159285 [Colletotrichum eremochloae]